MFEPTMKIPQKFMGIRKMNYFYKLKSWKLKRPNETILVNVTWYLVNS